MPAVRVDDRTPLAKDDLLQPSLTGARGPVKTIYSTRTGFFSSFFGGPIAGAIVVAVNSHRLGRLSKDVWLVSLGFALAAAVLWWQLRAGGNEWLQSTFGRNKRHFASQAIGLAYFGISFMVHRRYYRNMDFAGLIAPSGWRVGICAVVVSGAVTIGLALLIGR